MALALDRSGLDKEATFYALRHSYISRAIEGEVPLNVIADNCGTSIRMIETTYAKVLAGKRREFIERGARYIEPRPMDDVFTDFLRRRWVQRSMTAVSWSTISAVHFLEKN